MILTTISGFLDKFERGNVRILREMGYTVHYAANTYEQHYLFDEGEIRGMGVEIHHIDIARSPYMLRDNKKAFDQLVGLVRRYGIDMVHCHTPVGGVLGRLLGKFFEKDGLKILYTAHGFHFYKGAPLINNSVYYLVEKALARYTDALVVINQEDYQNAKHLHLRDGGNVYHIPGVGLDLEKFRALTAEQRAEGRRRLGLREEDFFVLSVGELNENKNQEVVLKALAKMREQGTELSGIRYGICGDGFFHERLKKMIQHLKLQDTVDMYGYCRNVPEILGCADVFVFPSKREGLGMAGLEALAMGIPVLAADNRGTREYMTRGVNGYTYSSTDVDGFIDGLEKVRRMEPEKLAKMKQDSIASARRFEWRYTDTIMREVYKHLDERIMEERRKEETGRDADEEGDRKREQEREQEREQGRGQNQCDHGGIQPAAPEPFGAGRGIHCPSDVSGMGTPSV